MHTSPTPSPRARRVALRLIWLLALPVIVACVQAPAQAPPPQDLVVRHGLELQVSPYLDDMPKVALTEGEITCNSLMILFSIRAGAEGFPPGLEVLSVEAMQLADGRASGAGAKLTVPVRETYFVEFLTTADNWSGNRVLRAGEAMPPGMKKERLLRGAAMTCPPDEWKQPVLVEVMLQLRAGAQTARLRAVRHYGA